MERFIERYRDRIVGTIAGFDRILFRGQILSICHIGGMERFLSSQRILNKEFRQFAEMFTERIRRHAKQVAKQNGRPYRYLPSPSISKEGYVRELMANNPVDERLVCVLSCGHFVVRERIADVNLSLTVFRISRFRPTDMRRERIMNFENSDV